MAEEARPPRLGRGLAALLGGGGNDASAPPPPTHRQRFVPLDAIRPNPRNPRTAFDPQELADLAGSIRARGVLQPIVVRSVEARDARFEIVAGERRWRAAAQAGVHDVPVIVVEADDRLALELAIIENVQRSDLNPVEEARGYQSLMADHAYTQAELGEVIGKSRSHVTNTLRLLKLPAPVLDHLANGDLSAGHARALLSSSQPEALAKEIMVKGLSVRDVERRVADKPEGRAKRRAEASDPNLKALASDLTEQTGLRIAIERSGEGGRVVIEFQNLEQFDHIHGKLKEL